MRQSMTLFIALLFSFAAFSQDQNAAQAAPAETPAKTANGQELKTQNDKVSYVIGISIGSSLKRDGLDLDLTLMMQGINDALNGTETMSRADQQALMQSFQAEMMAKQQAKREAEGKINAELSKKFLDENKTKEGVITTDSGLQYKIVKKGEGGEKPKSESKVKVHYRARLADGKEFDSSFQRGQPAEFSCNQLIQGWAEALQLMSPGDAFELYIPPELAYGPNGQGEIPPNAVLLFDVEMLEVMPAH